MDYKNIGQSPTILLKEFRKLMGIEDSQYQDFKRLNVRVIKEPLEEINTIASLDARVEYTKINKTVTALKFYFAKKPTAAPPVQPVFDALQKRLVDKFQLTSAQAKSVQKNYPSAYINESLSLVLQKHQQRLVKNLPAYTLTTLKNGYTPLLRTKKKPLL